MLLRESLIALVVASCIMTGISGCLYQNQDESGDGFVDTWNPIKCSADDLFATNDHLYAAESSITCYDWSGSIVWESSLLGSSSIVFLGDYIFTNTYDPRGDVGGIALLDWEGNSIWKKEMGIIELRGIGGSSGLLAAGSTTDKKTGILWAFSRDEDTMWTYNHPVRINEVVVAPDSSCVVFTDFNGCVNCVSDSRLIWSEKAGRISTGVLSRILAISSDSSYVVYGSSQEDSKVVARALSGDEIWFEPIEADLQTVAISEDSQTIVVGCYGAIYRFSRDGTLVWKKEVGQNNEHVALTPDADTIVMGSFGLPFVLWVLDGNGTVVWKARSSDTIFSVAITPNGEYVAFSNRLRQLFILPNSPEYLPEVL